MHRKRTVSDMTTTTKIKRHSHIKIATLQLSDVLHQSMASTTFKNTINNVYVNVSTWTKVYAVTEYVPWRCCCRGSRRVAPSRCDSWIVCNPPLL